MSSSVDKDRLSFLWSVDIFPVICKRSQIINEKWFPVLEEPSIPEATSHSISSGLLLPPGEESSLQHIVAAATGCSVRIAADKNTREFTSKKKFERCLTNMTKNRNGGYVKVPTQQRPFSACIRHHSIPSRIKGPTPHRNKISSATPDFRRHACQRQCQRLSNISIMYGNRTAEVTKRYPICSNLNNVGTNTESKFICYCRQSLRWTNDNNNWRCLPSTGIGNRRCRQPTRKFSFIML